jgi:hypothetical protein
MPGRQREPVAGARDSARRAGFAARGSKSSQAVRSRIGQNRGGLDLLSQPRDQPRDRSSVDDIVVDADGQAGRVGDEWQPAAAAPAEHTNCRDRSGARQTLPTLGIGQQSVPDESTEECRQPQPDRDETTGSSAGRPCSSRESTSLRLLVRPPPLGLRVGSGVLVVAADLRGISAR